MTSNVIYSMSKPGMLGHQFYDGVFFLQISFIIFQHQIETGQEVLSLFGSCGNRTQAHRVPLQYEADHHDQFMWAQRVDNPTLPLESKDNSCYWNGPDW